MRIGQLVWTSGTIDSYLDDVVAAERAGFATVWTPQVFAWDTLTVLALAATRTARIELGTAVIPIHPRHPLNLAAAALTTATVAGGRLTLGIGPSHQIVVEDIWGYRYDRPYAYTRDYLTALLPALAGQSVDVATDLVTARMARPLQTPGAASPDVLLAALGPRMLDLAGSVCGGTVTWLAGATAIRDHVVPRITRAAADAGRPAPRVVVGLPVCVTDDADAARARAARQFAMYTNLPAYRRMMDLDGAPGPADAALVGSAAQVGAHLDELAAAGATDLSATIFGTDAERDATRALLAERAATAPAA
jgi:5,10-methylenetetrahydromethanopterin reductase